MGVQLALLLQLGACDGGEVPGSMTVYKMSEQVLKVLRAELRVGIVAVGNGFPLRPQNFRNIQWVDGQGASRFARPAVVPGTKPRVAAVRRGCGAARLTVEAPSSRRAMAMSVVSMD